MRITGISTHVVGTPWRNLTYVQVHTDDYRNPSTLPAGPVLVVGGGNSGFQVAHELASTGRPVN